MERSLRNALLVGPAVAAIVAMASYASATEVPFGSHHGGRGGDSGAGSGSVSPTGGYGAEVPISLPPARGGETVPVAVTYTSSGRVGAAGVGWDIPLTYVEVNSSRSYRRPGYAPSYGEPRPALEQVNLVVGGSSERMTRDPSSPNLYRPMLGGLDTQLRRRGDAYWYLMDGAGRRLRFTHVQHLTAEDEASGDDEDPERRMQLWLLDSITDSTGQNRVELSYRIERVPLDGTVGLEILLDKVSYNFHQTFSNCAKHVVALSYDSWSGAEGAPVGAATVLGYAVQHGEIKVRTRILGAVDVLAASGNGCGAGHERLQRYELTYGADADTGLPRLSRVDILGRAGTPEETQARQVSAYEYGSVTPGEPGIGEDTPAAPDQVTFSATSSVNLPSAALDGLGLTDQADTAASHRAQTRQVLRDFTGDGLPDLVFKPAGEPTQIVPNVTSFDGTSLTALPAVRLFPTVAEADEPPLTEITVVVEEDEPSDDLPDEFDTSAGRGYLFWKLQETWVDTIDFNADGRLDIVDARHDYKWVLWINRPGATPHDIVWQQVELSLASIRDALAPTTGVIDVRKRIPLSLSISGRDFSAYDTCRKIVGITDEDEYGEGFPVFETISDTHCDSPMGPYPVTASAPIQTFTLWMLADVNGDGYPELVANTRGVGLWEADSCELQKEERVRMVHPPVRRACGKHYHVGLEAEPQVSRVFGDNYFGAPAKDNEVRVFYNHAGVRLGAGTPFAAPVAVSGAPSACAVEQSRGSASGSTMTCGLLDVTGDGIPERVIESDEYDAYIGTGERFAGRVGLPFSPSSQRAERGDVCKTSSNFSSWQATSVLDLTGDGIPDFLDADAGQLYIGTGTGWQRDEVSGVVLPGPVPIALPEQLTREDCNEYRSVAMKGLYDLDGDGRLDHLGRQNRKLSRSQVIGADGRVGALSAGRLVRVHNGYGATTTIEYDSAKQDSTMPHQVPFPEIVVTRTYDDVPRTPGEPGDRLSYQHFAYGGAHMYFHPLADRWQFTGYARQMTLIAEPTTDGPARLRGIATVTDSFGYDDLLGGGTAEERLTRYALVGRARQTHSLDGTFEPNLFEELAVLPLADPARRTHGGMQVAYAMKSESGLPLPTDLTTVDCTDLSDPYDFAASYATGSTSDPLCTVAAVAYPAVTASWKGEDPPTVSNNNVQTKTTIVDADDVGRPLVILHENDLARADDDLCETVVYAENVGYLTAQLDAVHIRRLAVPVRGTTGTSQGQPSCDGATHIVSGVRYRYDNLPEGQARAGLNTHVIVERYDVNTGDLLDEYVSSQTTYNAHGAVQVARSFGDDDLSRTVEMVYPPETFGLTPRSVVTTATDVDVAMTQSAVLDPATLAPLSMTDANGLTTGNDYDGLGRVTAEWIIDPSTGEKIVLGSAMYEEIPSAAMTVRRTTTRSYLDGVPYADYLADSGTSVLGTNERIVELDSVGQTHHVDTLLGADYGGEVIRTGETTYDAFGRPSFVADPYLLIGEMGAVRYGTTYFYYDDGQLECAIRGRGPQAAGRFTDESEARFATCVDVRFAAGQRITEVRGPNELNLTDSHFGQFEQTVQSAVGWPLSTSRWAGSEPIELSSHEFDPLGHVTLLRRHQGEADAVVDWTMTYDSLGRTRTLAEPATAERRFEYNWWGQRTATQWGDGDETRVLTVQYDGLGRARRTTDPIAEETVCHTYDVPTVSADHLLASNLLGRLSHSVRIDEDLPTNGGDYLGSCEAAADSTYHVYYGYDDFGRVRAVSRVGDDDRRYAQASEYHLDGRVESLTFLPFEAPEVTIRYSYDGMGRATGVSWNDALGAEDVFTAPGGVDSTGERSIDPFGRYRHVVLGNGVHEYFNYRDGDRRELYAKVTTTADGTYGSAFTKYDGDLRVTQRYDLRPGSDARWIDYAYDGRYRLTEERRLPLALSTTTVESFEYDSLGNLRQVARGEGTLDIVPDATDRDRVCRVQREAPPPVPPPLPIGGGGIASSTERPLLDITLSAACDYHYDALGAVTQIDGATPRLFGYDGYSRVVSMTRGAATAKLRYDPTGAVASVDVTEAGNHNRADRRYGPLVETAVFPADETSTTALEIRVLGPLGIIMARRDATNVGDDTTLYFHGGHTGVRFTTNASGRVAQEIDYRPFGDALLDTAEPGTLDYTKYQFNGGDRLAAFGVSHLGARLLDSETGRFLQRDPLLIPRTASLAHPYAFAWNDPINQTDVTGMDPQCDSMSYCGSGPQVWLRHYLPVDRRTGLSEIESFNRYVHFKRVQQQYDKALRGHAERIFRSLPRAELNKYFYNQTGCSHALANCPGGNELRESIISDLVRQMKNLDHGFRSRNRAEPGEGVSAADRASWYESPSFIAEVVLPVADAAMWIWGGAGLYKLGKFGLGRIAARRAAARAAAGGGSRAAVTIGCFIAGTPVHTEEATVPIESIAPGDVVRCADIEQGTWSVCEVADVMRHQYVGDLIEIELDGDTIEATTNHPFWVVEGASLDVRRNPDNLPTNEAELRVRGGRWLQAEELLPGDRLLIAGDRSTVTVKAVRRRPVDVEVYNFAVRGQRNYAVGRHAVLVHNTSRTPLLPNQLPGLLEAETAAARSVGAGPIRAGTPAFDQALNSGTIKWVVTESGELLIAPHTVRGVEISHAVLSGGRPVVAAGHADVAVAGGRYVGLEFNAASGHFGEGVAEFGKSAFAELGIFF